MSERLETALSLIDAANGEDPNLLDVGDGPRPKEVVHAEAVTEWVRRLDPDADELQFVAARAHHLRRWTVARDTYPAGRAGYLRWRRDRKAQHAEDVAAIMDEAGYGPAEIEGVQAIIRKDGLGTDPRAQVHEDALCLVFLELQLEDLAARLEPTRSIEVLDKTIAKMSPAARALALDLPLATDSAAMISRSVRDVAGSVPGPG